MNASLSSQSAMPAAGAPPLHTPFWWEGVLPLALPAHPLPPAVDVAVIGAGYTGLIVALQLARAGRSVAVLEAGQVGQGASSRNGGMCGDLLKPSFSSLVEQYGHPIATRIYGEARDALVAFPEFLAAAGIECDFRRCGRVAGALSQSQLDGLIAQAETLRREVGIEYEALSRDDLRAELGTDAYVGARLMPHHGGLHPARYVAGLAGAAQAAGAVIHERTPMLGYRRRGAVFHVRTSRGELQARDLVVATNGYTGPATAALRRRLIPVTSYMIATEPIGAELIARIFPTGRMATDTNRLLCYYRPCPKGERILFGGRPFYTEVSPERSAGRLRAHLVRLFPELESVRISHSWFGNIAYTFDHLPHAGRLDGAYYVGGCCGSGVVMTAWLGAKVAAQLLGRPEQHTVFSEIEHPTHPLYYGRPWFLPLVQAWYQAGDLWSRK